MGLPEALVLAGLILVILGALIALIGLLRAIMAPPGEGGAAGIILIGPVPIVFGGRGAKLITLIALVLLGVVVALLLITWLGWGP